MICIIDYRMGNLRSVQKALQKVGAQDVTIAREPAELAQASKLILPGVGAFADGMHYLNELGWTPAIDEYLQTGRPLLGICLGMQLLFEGSEEDAEAGALVSGLGVLKGKVVRFQEDQGEGQPRLKVPHMGWNSLDFSHRSDNPLFAGLDNHSHCYFVHGYYCQPADETIAAAWTGYGSRFCSSIWRESIWATQFHPEKSQRVGLHMLKNFVEKV